MMGKTKAHLLRSKFLVWPTSNEGRRITNATLDIYWAFVFCCTICFERCHTWTSLTLCLGLLKGREGKWKERGEREKRKHLSICVFECKGEEKGMKNNYKLVSQKNSKFSYPSQGYRSNFEKKVNNALHFFLSNWMENKKWKLVVT